MLVRKLAITIFPNSNILNIVPRFEKKPIFIFFASNTPNIFLWFKTQSILRSVNIFYPYLLPRCPNVPIKILSNRKSPTEKNFQHALSKERISTKSTTRSEKKERSITLKSQNYSPPTISKPRDPTHKTPIHPHDATLKPSENWSNSIITNSNSNAYYPDGLVWAVERNTSVSG